LDKGTVLIEGNSHALEFLGRLLLAHAAGTDCGFELSPKGAGSAWFSKDARLGFYVHRLPCNRNRLRRHGTVKDGRSAKKKS
jgi:hypothetical protein